MQDPTFNDTLEKKFGGRWRGGGEMGAGSLRGRCAVMIEGRCAVVFVGVSTVVLTGGKESREGGEYGRCRR